jgi:hypothetical protein
MKVQRQYRPCEVASVTGDIWSLWGPRTLLHGRGGTFGTRIYQMVNAYTWKTMIERAVSTNNRDLDNFTAKQGLGFGIEPIWYR